MNDSPLLLLNGDISSVIGEYLRTIKQRKKTNREFKRKFKRCILKEFNIQLNQWKPVDIQYIPEESLYRGPRISGRGPWWVWEGKRQDSSTQSFKIYNKKDGTGHFCSCMRYCRSPRCPFGCMRWKARMYPPNPKYYYNYKSLLNEIKK